jgi:hypothetical protein
MSAVPGGGGRTGTPSEGHMPAATLSLLASVSTLLCCALPALLVSIGAGATLVALTGAVPQLIWLSAHKDPLFLAAGLMLVAAGALQWRARSLPCPIDPVRAGACARARRTSLRVWGASVTLYMVGIAFAFVLPVLG